MATKVELKQAEADREFSTGAVFGSDVLRAPIFERLLALVAATAGYAEHPAFTQFFEAASSVPANLAEGLGRSSRPYLFCFLRIARGSAFECVIWSRVVGDADLADRWMRMADELAGLWSGD